MSDLPKPDTQFETCGCCGGNTAATPVDVANRPGLAAVRARVGTYSDFRESMLAGLSSARYPALAALRTREPGDFSVALVDTWAVVADVLTFYQERIANESYLRTATELGSVRELAAEIGYNLKRGVAASTPLAFTVEDAPGSPRVTTVPRGTQVQSIPSAPGELPQTFETTHEIEARAELNVLHPRLTETQPLKELHPTTGQMVGKRHAYLAGIVDDIKPGEGLLFVSATREQAPAGDGKFDFRVVATSEPDRVNGWTRITWDRRLTEDVFDDAPSVYLLRQRAAVFGHNAPDWRPLPDSMKANYLGIKNAEDLVPQEQVAWPHYTILSPVFPGNRGPDVLPGEPNDYFAPFIRPTPKSIAAAAIKAAQSVAESRQRDALDALISKVKEAIAVLDSIYIDAKSAIKGLNTDANSPINRIGAILTQLKDFLLSGPTVAQLEAKVSELQQKLNEAKDALKALKKSIEEGNIANIPGAIQTLIDEKF